MSPDVVVVGGGVIGTAVAYWLAREGVRVELLERGQLADGSSGAAAGMLTPYCEASGPGPMLSWGAQGLELLAGLCPELAETSGVDPEWVRSGTLRIARDEAGEAELRRRLGELPDLGLQWLDAGELQRLLPSLSGDVRGAIHSSREAHVRSPLLVRATAAAAERLGARIRTGASVLDVGCEGGRVAAVHTPKETIPTGAVVWCVGSYAAEAPVHALPAIPITPVRGQIARLQPIGERFGPILWDDDVYLVPKRDGSVVVGATSERVGFDRRVTAGGVEGLLAAGSRLVPELESATFLGAWAGLRPDTPDHRPLVGPAPGLPGLLLAVGHYRTGVLLSAVTGRMVADGVLGKGWAEPAFLPERFA